MSPDASAPSVAETTPGRNAKDDTAPVLLPLALEGAYDYAVPVGIDRTPGTFVRVPLGTSSRIGVIWDTSADDGPVSSAKLKPITEALPLPPLPNETRQFIDWVARYTLAPPGSILRMAIATPGLFKPPKTIRVYQASGREPERITAARTRVLDVLRDGPPRTASELAEIASVGVSVIKNLAEQGVLDVLEVAEHVSSSAQPDPDVAGPNLSDEQEQSASTLRDAVNANTYSTVLLEGVTGSGKTEVYFEAIAEALRESPDAQVLVLVPEIALTNQLLERFEERFEAPPLAWHSGLTGGARRRAWLAVAGGSARVVVGARSALFLPFKKLQLIIVDEEHDPAYKQEDQVIYHARDMAIVRATLADCPAILVSATPSLETVVNCTQGKYSRVMLSNRHGGATLPDIAPIDMRAEETPRGEWLSPTLLKALEENVERGEQSLLFLNRRGYAPAAICRACGFRLQREGCSAPLVVHRYGNRLQCHHCDYSIPMPKACPDCSAEDSIISYGPGVERLAEETAMRFPDQRIAVLASDTVRNPAETQAFINRIERHELDIVIGTQLVTKGHNFPMLTLVGVIDADLGLSGGDLRAGERTYQQLWQVAGRAGRAERPGRVLLQTYMPEHPVMQALVAGDGPAFFEREAEAREMAGWPPFGKLAAVILSGKNEADVSAQARALARRAPDHPDITVMGPVPAPFARLRGRYRYRLLVKASRTVSLQRVLREWLSRVPEKSSVRVAVDIDPYSFL